MKNIKLNIHFVSQRSINIGPVHNPIAYLQLIRFVFKDPTSPFSARSTSKPINKAFKAIMMPMPDSNSCWAGKVPKIIPKRLCRIGFRMCGANERFQLMSIVNPVNAFFQLKDLIEMEGRRASPHQETKSLGIK